MRIEISVHKKIRRKSVIQNIVYIRSFLGQLAVGDITVPAVESWSLCSVALVILSRLSK